MVKFATPPGRRLLYVGPHEMSIDWVEVSRTAHQVELDHGRIGYLYAERLSLEAMNDSCQKEAGFWAEVAAALRPRNVMPNNSFNPDAQERAG